MQISDDHLLPAQKYLPAMITQHKPRITTTVPSGLAKLIQYLSLHFLTALTVTLDRHGGDCLKLFHRQPHLLPPAFSAAAVSTFSSRFYMSHHEVGCATTDENVYAVGGRWR